MFTTIENSSALLIQTTQERIGMITKMQQEAVQGHEESLDKIQVIEHYEDGVYKVQRKELGYKSNENVSRAKK